MGRACRRRDRNFNNMLSPSDITHALYNRIDLEKNI